MTPEGWNRRKLDDVAELIGGTTPSKAVLDYWDGDIPWATPSDITSLSASENYIYDTSSKITKRALEETSVRLLNPGSVLMTSRATIGEVVINMVPMATNQGFCNFIPNSSINAEYLTNWLKFYKKKLERLAAGSTFLEISKKTLKNIEIDLPPLPEQKKIAVILRSVDDAIQATKAVIDQTSKVKQGILQQLLTRGIGHTRFNQTEIGMIPETWKVATTGQICTSIVPGRDKPKCFNGDIPWLTISDIDGLKINESKLGLKVTKQELQRVNGKTVPKDTVLMTCVGTFGTVAVAGRELVMNQQLHGFVCGSEVLPLYLCLVLQTKESDMKKISGQTTIPYLNKAKCESICVPLPPINEQKQIVDQIVSIEENINANKKYLDGLSSLKRGLMQDLLTGRMRVRGST